MHIRILILLLLATAISCDKQPCKNNNLVFDKFPHGSKEYNNELVKQLQKPGADPDFWVAPYQYIEDNETEYMNVEVQGKMWCANVLMEITGNENLASYRKAKGAYGGALIGLKYHTVKNDSSYTFVFDDVDLLIE